jgi:tape measure domain-containing protein
VTSNILEFYVKMKDMMSGGLAKLSQNSRSTFTEMQNDFEKTARKNREMADSFEANAKRAKSSWGGVGDFIKGQLGADAIKGALSAGFEFIKGSVSKAMEFGKTKESFKVLTGSDQKGVGLANDLNKLQQDTILGPEVFKAAQTMLGFGISSDKVLPTMRMLGDISMGDAQKLESLTLAFSQIHAAGKLQGQDLLQLINAGFNPLNEISRTTGKSMAQLKEDMQQGAISASMVEKAFQTATSKGGLFNGMMDKLADTPAGKMAQLEGQFESFQVKAGEAFMPLATALMDMGAPLLDMASKYLPAIGQFISDIVGYVTGAKEMTGNWSEYFAIAKEYVAIIWDGLSHVFGVVWHIAQGIFDWISHSEILKDTFAAIKDFAFIIWGLIKQAADAIGWLWDNVVKPVLDGLDQAYKWIKGIFGGKSEVKISTSVPKATSTSSVTAAQAVKDTAPVTPKTDESTGKVGKDIASGGPRVINITIGKMVEKIEMHVGGVQEGLQNIERQVEEVFLRVLNSGASVQ